MAAKRWRRNVIAQSRVMARITALSKRNQQRKSARRRNGVMASMAAKSEAKASGIANGVNKALEMAKAAAYRAPTAHACENRRHQLKAQRKQRSHPAPPSAVACISVSISAGSGLKAESLMA